MLVNEICSLERAQKLKYLGFEQDSQFYYVRRITKRWPPTQDCSNYSYRFPVLAKNDLKEDDISRWSAYTINELGKILPGTIIVTGMKDENNKPLGDLTLILLIKKCCVPDEENILQEMWCFNYVHQEMLDEENIISKLFPEDIQCFNEADGRAELLINLVDYGFYKN